MCDVTSDATSISAAIQPRPDFVLGLAVQHDSHSNISSHMQMTGCYAGIPAVSPQDTNNVR